MRIDYVIPFVDGSDEVWRRIYAEHDAVNKREARSRDWDILRYQLRSIETYMPWVGNIYIVLSVGPSQIPSWLNTTNERIHIVYDWEIVPKKYLPVFNSNVIDLYIPKIKGLNEHYLYACDDYLITAPRCCRDFFTEDSIRIDIDTTDWKDCMYARTILNSAMLIAPDKVSDSVRGYTTPYCNHPIVPHVKSENLKLLKQYRKQIEHSITTFRDYRNLTWLIYVLNADRNGMRKDSGLITSVINITDMGVIRNIDYKCCDVLVLNDDWKGDGWQEGKKLLQEDMKRMFPIKSGFEL